MSPKTAPSSTASSSSAWAAHANTGSVRLPPLTGVLFGGAGQQVSEAQPLFVTLPGRGRYAVPVKHVPKVIMFTGLRERLALQLLKLAGGPFTGTLLHELEGLEARITAARHVSIQPGSAEDHDDLADALALGVWLAREYDAERSRHPAALWPRRPAPSARRGRKLGFDALYQPLATRSYAGRPLIARPRRPKLLSQRRTRGPA